MNMSNFLNNLMSKYQSFKESRAALNSPTISGIDKNDIKINETLDPNSREISLAEIEASRPKRKTIGERIFGQVPTIPSQFDNGTDESGNPNFSITTTATPRQGGAISNFQKGLHENYNNKFSTDNFGQNKGWMTRAGEALGTGLRWFDSPIGRGLAAGALIKALGGDNKQALVYGLGAGVGRQQNRAADQLYRNQLEEQGVNTSDIQGNIDKDMFNSVGNMQNKITNTVIKQQATQSMNKLRELQAQKLEIENSTLPEIQKAKLIQELAKAEYAERMQLAKIKAYENGSTLGWLNFNLKADKEAKEQAALDKLLNGTGKDNTTTYKEGQTATNPKTGEKMIFRGGKWQQM